MPPIANFLDKLHFIYCMTLVHCWGVPYRWTHPHVSYTNWALFCAVVVSVLFQSSLSELLPRAVTFLIKLRTGFSQLSFVYVLFAFNIFLITNFCVVSSFEPPLDHNIYVTVKLSAFIKWKIFNLRFNQKYD